MKEQQKIAILLPLVILIWGYAMYKWANISGGAVTSTAQVKIEMPENLVLSNDTFELFLNYPDPFMKGISYAPTAKSETPSSEKPLTKTEKRPETKPQLQWPKLVFKGTITNKNSKEQIAVLEINGNESLLKEGEEYQAVQLIQLAGDSILVGFQNEKKFVVK